MRSGVKFEIRLFVESSRVVDRFLIPNFPIDALINLAPAY